MLTDGQATRTALLQSLAWLQGEMTLADTGVVFFAGRADVDGQGELQLLAGNAQGRQLRAPRLPPANCGKH